MEMETLKPLLLLLRMGNAIQLKPLNIRTKSILSWSSRRFLAAAPISGPSLLSYINGPFLAKILTHSIGGSGSPPNVTLSCICRILCKVIPVFHADCRLTNSSTHEALNNATYNDCSKEISFNRVWLQHSGISSARYYSPNGLIPPAITGLHNADAIKAWMDNGIKYVVGDNTRPPLFNHVCFLKLASKLLTNMLQAKRLVAPNLLPKGQWIWRPCHHTPLGDYNILQLRSTRLHTSGMDQNLCRIW
jgi:hypothetical protein